MYFSRIVNGWRLAGVSFVFSKSGIIPNIRLGGSARSCTAGFSGAGLAGGFTADGDGGSDSAPRVGCGFVSTLLCAERERATTHDVRTTNRIRTRIEFIATKSSSPRGRG